MRGSPSRTVHKYRNIYCIKTVRTYYDFIMAGSLFYFIDITIALSIPFIMAIMRLRGNLRRFSWILYWFGCGVGALWEIPFYFIGPDFSSAPLYILKTPTPYPLFPAALCALFLGRGPLHGRLFPG
jgi:hypothetical protein